MRRTERVYLTAVLVLAIIFAWITVTQAGKAISRLTTPEAAGTPSAGQPRDVDLERIKELIRDKRLSGHEADFYKKVPVPDTGEKAPSNSR
jgi:hypothetical protein